MDNKFCSYCKYYQCEKNNKYICKNKKSGEFNTNPAPFQGCSCFIKTGILTGPESRIGTGGIKENENISSM